MPMSSDMAAYIAQGHAAAGPDGEFAPGGAETSVKWYAFKEGWKAVLPSPSAEAMSEIRLATWNVDGWAAHTEARLRAIVDRIRSLNPNVILLQELNGQATKAVLDNEWIQEEFYISDAFPEPENSGVPIKQTTLVSKACSPGRVWSVSLPSRYERNFVCTDIDGVRILNVHLDSLAHDPSFRPEQVHMAASIVREARAGVIAGDWNPVMKVDHTLVQENNLQDAWEQLCPEEEGFTWNWDGRSKEPYPPQRLDKVAYTSLEARHIEVLEPGSVHGE